MKVQFDYLKSVTKLKSKTKIARRNFRRKLSSTSSEYACVYLFGSKIDPLIQKYRKATSYNGKGVLNTTVAIAAAKGLTKRYPFLEKNHLEKKNLGLKAFSAVLFLFAI